MTHATHTSRFGHNPDIGSSKDLPSVESSKYQKYQKLQAKPNPNNLSFLKVILGGFVFYWGACVRHGGVLWGIRMNYKDMEVDERLKELYSLKEYDQCLEACKEKLTENPLNLQALIYSADIHHKQKDFEACIHYCDTIIRGVDDQISFAWLWRAQSQSALKQYEDAQESYDKAVMYDPTDIETWSFLALNFYMKGEKDIAMVLLDKIEKKLEQPGAFAMVRGHIERADGNKDDAFMHFLEGEMAADPTSPKYEEEKEVFARLARKTLEK